jgi:hypothetical protein
MLSSSLKRPTMRNRILKSGRGLIWATAVMAVAPGMAAEVYYQPIITVAAEADSNLDLDPGVKQWVEGYVADAATLIGIATPNTDTIIKPRIIYRDYPQDSADDRVEAHLDFNSDYRTQRSDANLSGSLQHVDEFNAEQATAFYNDVNPGQPITTDTGKVTNGATRDSAFLAPKYLYNLTPVIGVGFTGQYQIVSYSPADENHNDYTYYQGRAYMRWAFTQSSDTQLGAFGSKFDSTHLGNSATGAGATLDLNTSWTPLLSTKVSLIYQHTDINDVSPDPLSVDNNTWGATVGAVYKTQLDQFRLDLGRTISPSGSGGLYNVDRVQFQDDRNLTTRLSITGALVGLKTHALTSNIAGDDRKYAQAIVELRWMMTRYWFVQGGYQYAYQKYEYDVDSAANNRVYLQFGYQGLARQR